MKIFISLTLLFLLSVVNLANALPLKYTESPPTPLPVIVPDPGQVIGLPGLEQLTPKQYAGQIKVSDCGNYLFFWFVESQSSPTDPVVVWLNGGPGASSMMGFFMENGPFKITKSEDNALTLKPRFDSWNKNANYMGAFAGWLIILGIPA